MKDYIESSAMAADFLAMNEFLGAAGDPATALTRLVKLAVRTVPGCEWAAVTEWPEKQAPISVSCSDAVAFSIDELQYALGDGPSLVEDQHPRPVSIPDLRREVRWPRFVAAVAVETPVRGMLSVPVLDSPHRTVLNVYSSRPGFMGTDTLSLTALLAAHVRVLLVQSERADEAAQNLENAISTSRQVGMAIGILMTVHGISEEQAFALLRLTSQHLNRKLPDVAKDVARTGRLPF